MGETESVGFNASVEWHLGLDFVTEQHKSLPKLQPQHYCRDVWEWLATFTFPPIPISSVPIPFP